MAAIARIAARLLRRNRRQLAAVDPIGVVLDAAAEPGAVVAIPGLAAWLGGETAPGDDDFMASLVGGFTESFEDYCTRISRKQVAS